MKRLICLLLGILFVMAFAVGAMAEVLDESVEPTAEVTEETGDNPEADPGTETEEPGMTQEEIGNYVEGLRQSVQSQLAVADMALSMARSQAMEEETAPTPDGTVQDGTTDGDVSEETESEEVMDPAKAMELAERHAFIAYAHVTGIPASRKLQENVEEFQELWSGVVAGTATVSEAFANAAKAGELDGMGTKGKGAGDFNPGHFSKEAKVKQKAGLQACQSASVGQGNGKSKGKADKSGSGSNGNHGGGNGGNHGGGNDGGHGGGNGGGHGGGSKK